MQEILYLYNFGGGGGGRSMIKEIIDQI